MAYTHTWEIKTATKTVEGEISFEPGSEPKLKVNSSLALTIKQHQLFSSLLNNFTNFVRYFDDSDLEKLEILRK